MKIENLLKKIPERKINAGLRITALAGAAVCIAVFFIPAARSAIIQFFEILLGRRLNPPHWDGLLAKWAPTGLLLCAVMALIAERKRPVILKWLARVKKQLNNHKKLIITAFFVLMTVNFLKSLNLPAAGAGLDPSWKWAVNNIAYNHQYTFGKDVTFTYGPLGYLFESQHYAETIIQGIALNVFCVGVILLLFYLNYKKKMYSIQKLFIFSLFLFIFTGIISCEWIWNIMLFFLFSTCYLLREDKRLRFPLIICAGFLSAFSLLLKFNTAVLAAALSGALALMLLLRGGKRLFAWYIGLFFPAYIAFTAAGSAFFFKNINNFIVWLQMSVEIAGGFSSAMVVKGLFIFTAAAVLIIIIYLRFAYTQKKENVFALCVIGTAVLFFSFKHGFVRQDGHMLSFFTAVPFLTGFLFLFSPPSSYKKSRAMFQTTVFLCLLGAVNIVFIPGLIKGVFNNAYLITQLGKNYKTFNERKMEGPKADALPAEWNAKIADSSIQATPWELSYAAANHWKGWRPNPVMQLYSVYTKKLDEYSAASFAPENAPRFILLEYYAIDGRNMFVDSPATWNAILPNYTILTRDESRALLSKKDAHKSLNFEPVFSASYKFNETIPVPQSPDPVYAKIIIKDSIFGKLATTLFRGNPPSMTVKYHDGAPGGGGGCKMFSFKRGYVAKPRDAELH
ncbi:MAG: hypothetical protein LBC53_08705, partial [Spirochaetaceae bacterium]|nr:hypothetical protein [Spirochaetaceae bacterium]